MVPTPAGADAPTIPSASPAPLIVLLDLNYTLVANSNETRGIRGPYARQIAAERYRLSLVELVRPHYVCLITVRNVRYQKQTLEQIAAQCGGWQPQETYFNTWPEGGAKVAPLWKQHVLLTELRPRFGEGPYLAVESNNDTIDMYALNGVLALKVWFGQHGAAPPAPALPTQLPLS